MNITFWSDCIVVRTAQSFARVRISGSLLFLGALVADGASIPVLAAELAPKGAYVSTEITCADFDAGNGNAMSLIEVEGMRFSSGKAYCDMTPTAKPDVYRAVCRAYPLPGATSTNDDAIEFEGEKVFQWVPPDTIIVDGDRPFKRCELTP